MRGSKREAERALARLVLEADLTAAQPIRERTVAVLLRAWLEHATPSFAPKTAQMTKLCVEQVIVPALGSIPVEKLTPLDLDRFYRHLLTEGTTKGSCRPSTVRRMHGIVRCGLSQGVRWGWLGHNPALDASPPRCRSGRRGHRSPRTWSASLSWPSSAILTSPPFSIWRHRPALVVASSFSRPFLCVSHAASGWVPGGQLVEVPSSFDTLGSPIKVEDKADPFRSQHLERGHVTDSDPEAGVRDLNLLGGAGDHLVGNDDIPVGVSVRREVVVSILKEGCYPGRLVSGAGRPGAGGLETWQDTGIRLQEESLVADPPTMRGGHRRLLALQRPCRC